MQTTFKPGSRTAGGANSNMTRSLASKAAAANAEEGDFAAQREGRRQQHDLRLSFGKMSGEFGSGEPTHHAYANDGAGEPDVEMGLGLGMSLDEDVAACGSHSLGAGSRQSGASTHTFRADTDARKGAQDTTYVSPFDDARDYTQSPTWRR